MSDWAERAPSASVPRLPETSSRMPRLAASWLSTPASREVVSSRRARWLLSAPRTEAMLPEACASEALIAGTDSPSCLLASRAAALESAVAASRESPSSPIDASAAPALRSTLFRPSRTAREAAVRSSSALVAASS